MSFRLLRRLPLLPLCLYLLGCSSDEQLANGRVVDAGVVDARVGMQDIAGAKLDRSSDAPVDLAEVTDVESPQNVEPVWSECLDTCDHVTSAKCREVLVSDDPDYGECFSGECFRANATKGPCGAASDPYCCNAFQMIDTPDLNEFTVELRVKFDVLPLPSHGGCKVLRFHTKDHAYGMGAAPLLMHPGPPERQFYWSKVNGGTLTVTDAVTHVAFCEQVSDKTYDCTNQWIKLATTMNFEANKWRKLTTYVRWPSAAGASDGEMKFWIDDVLIFTLTDVEDEQSGGKTFRKLRVLPISEGTVPFHQYWDEIKIYEGHVPPAS